MTFKQGDWRIDATQVVDDELPLLKQSCCQTEYQPLSTQVACICWLRPVRVTTARPMISAMRLSRVFTSRFTCRRESSRPHAASFSLAEHVVERSRAEDELASADSGNGPNLSCSCLIKSPAPAFGLSCSEHDEVARYSAVCTSVRLADSSIDTLKQPLLVAVVRPLKRAVRIRDVFQPATERDDLVAARRRAERSLIARLRG